MKFLVLTVVAALAGCASIDVPAVSAPLAGMEEPLELMGEPQDESARAALPKGSFTGLEVGDSRASLDALAGEPEGVIVTAVVENSPADAAGLEIGDLVLEARASTTVALHWPSEWRRIELESEPGTAIALVVDRAGAERIFRVVTVPRVHPAQRVAAERFREERRVGVVLRTATEVEARAAALGSGGGAVVVGLTRESPWRGAGVRYGDLVRAASGTEIAHPQALVDAIRNASADSALELELVRDGALVTLRAPLSARARELARVSIPLLFEYQKQRDRTSYSLLLGLFSHERTTAAWETTLLWLIRFAGGDADRLETIDA
ncbi:MAG: PDZ domain-containing protein [Planctomycetes bacterium]|nr:PDZ domain-containing protein [Planctomycetota bacterium]